MYVWLRWRGLPCTQPTLSPKILLLLVVTHNALIRLEYPTARYVVSVVVLYSTPYPSKMEGATHCHDWSRITRLQQAVNGYTKTQESGLLLL